MTGTSGEALPLVTGVRKPTTRSSMAQFEHGAVRGVNMAESSNPD
jgi:hypothetical protein